MDIAIGWGDVLVTYIFSGQPRTETLWHKRWDQNVMGLYVHSLSRLPNDLEKDYYIYLLDFDFEDSFNQVLQKNFRKIADFAARHRTVVLAGTNPRDFVEQVFSVHVQNDQFNYRSINGEDGEAILPAIMITTIHPNKFKDRTEEENIGDRNDYLLLIPLRKICGTGIEVIGVIEGVLQDIAAGRSLTNFQVSKKIHAEKTHGFSNAIILKPTLWGMGVDIKALIISFKALPGRKGKEPP